MKTYRLNTSSGFIHPAWLNRMNGRTLDGVVSEIGTLDADGQTLCFPAERLPPGTAVRIHFGRWFTCVTLEDALKEEAERRLAAERAEAEQRDELNRASAEAQAFNERIRLPVRWSVGIKDVLSGLSARSHGDGRNRATVEHILLEQDLDAGRLRRKAGDFLCTSRGGSNGKQYAAQPVEVRTDGDGQSFAPKVTCRRCLSLAARWMHPEEPQSSSSELTL